MTGDNQTVLIVAAAIVVLLLIGWLFARQRRSRVLRDKFGDEYSRTLDAAGSRTKAEADLVERTRRAEHLQLRVLQPDERQNYIADWTATKALFVDDPVGAIDRSDRLLADLMQLRGYSMGDFATRHGDLTVTHGDVAKHYLAGHEIAERSARGDATTEELRQALQHYDRLFTGLIADSDTTAPVRPNA